MPQAMKRTTTIAVAALISAVGLVPVDVASAAKSDPNGTARATASAPATDNSTEATLRCAGYDAPSPTYSSSNQNFSWGMKTICNYVDPNLFIHTWLYSIVGTGDHEEQVYQDDIIKNGAGSTLTATTNRKCLVRTTGRWIVKTYASAETIGNMIPYPAWGPVFTLGCSDID